MTPIPVSWANGEGVLVEIFPPGTQGFHPFKPTYVVADAEGGDIFYFYPGSPDGDHAPKASADWTMAPYTPPPRFQGNIGGF